jgi:hypothetical protein
VRLRRWLYRLTGLSGLLALSGCFAPPAGVQETKSVQAQTLNNYRSNMQKVTTALTDAYRKSEYKRVDALLEQDRKFIASTSPNAPDAAVQFGKAFENWKSGIAAVDAEVARVSAVAVAADADFLLNLKLQALVDQFDNGQITTDMATKFVNDILNLVHPK